MRSMHEKGSPLVLPSCLLERWENGYTEARLECSPASARWWPTGGLGGRLGVHETHIPRKGGQHFLPIPIKISYLRSPPYTPLARSPFFLRYLCDKPCLPLTSLHAQFDSGVPVIRLPAGGFLIEAPPGALVDEIALLTSPDTPPPTAYVMGGLSVMPRFLLEHPRALLSPIAWTRG